MADLKKTQDEWTDLFREWTQYMRPARILIDLRRRFRESRIRVLEQFETEGVLSQWKFSGAERGRNCTEDGRLFVDLGDENPGADKASVQVYKASAKQAGDLVASGAGDNGATITLNQKNSSGLSGSVKLGTVTASSTSIELALDIDEILKAHRAFANDRVGREADRTFLNQIASIFNRLTEAVNTVKSDIEANFVRTRIASFLKSTTTTVVSSSETTDESGDTVVEFTGLLEELKDAMGDESVAGAQSILKNTVTTGSPEFDPDNVGSGTLAVLSTRENAPSGLLELRCTAGKEETLSETFSASLRLDVGGNLTATNRLVIKKAWESSGLGLRLRLSRVITDENDDDDQVTDYVVNGESLSNTDNGDLHQVLEDTGGGNRRLRWYKASAKAAADLVAEGTRNGDGVVTMQEKNGSGLSGSANITYVGDDDNMIVHLNPFAKDDVIRMTVTNDEKGILQTLIRSLWSFSLPSHASNPTLPDTLIREAKDVISAIS